MKLRIALVIFFLLALSPLHAATNVYYAATSAGSNNGTDCADAYVYNDATNGVTLSGNWGSGQLIAPGTTIHLCGTFTFSAGAQPFSTYASGTSGNPITWKMETGAILQAPYFSVFGAISAGQGTSYITFDGGTNGLIQSTDDGSALTYQLDEGAIYVSSNGGTVTNIIIQNWHTSMYKHTLATDTSGAGGIEFSLQGQISNSLITQNTITDGQVGITLNGSGTGANTDEISYNTISRNNWAVNIGDGPMSPGPYIHDNDFSCVVASPCNWNDNADTNHHNGIMNDAGAGGPSGAVTGMVIANNFIHDINPSSAYIFFDETPGDAVSTQIYNNIFFTTTGQAGPNDGFASPGGAQGTMGDGGLLANNVFSGPNAGYAIGSHQFDVIYNNILANNASIGLLLACSSCSTAGSGNITSDYNDLYGTNGTLFQSDLSGGSTPYSTVAGWTSASGQDTHSITANPNLNSDFTLPGGSPAIGVGKNLTSLSITGLDIGAPQTFGVGSSCGTGCVARASSGAWDLGAYPTGGSSVCSTAYSPGTLSFGSVSDGGTASLTETLSNTGSAACTGSIAITTGTYFSITGGTCSTGSLSVAPSGSCTVIVKFTPAAHVGSVSDSLVFTTNAGSSPDSEALTGTGSSSSPSTSPIGIMIGKVAAPSTACNPPGVTTNACMAVTGSWTDSAASTTSYNLFGAGNILKFGRGEPGTSNSMTYIGNAVSSVYLCICDGSGNCSCATP